MKKIISIIILILVLTITGCGQNEEHTNNSNNNANIKPNTISLMDLSDRDKMLIYLSGCGIPAFYNIDARDFQNYYFTLSYHLLNEGEWHEYTFSEEQITKDYWNYMLSINALDEEYDNDILYKSTFFNNNFEIITGFNSNIKDYRKDVTNTSTIILNQEVKLEEDKSIIIYSLFGSKSGNVQAKVPTYLDELKNDEWLNRYDYGTAFTITISKDPKME